MSKLLELTDLCKDYKSVIIQFVDNINSLKVFIDYIKPTIESREEDFHKSNNSFFNLMFKLSDLENHNNQDSEEYKDLVRIKSELEKNFGFTLKSEKIDSKVNFTYNNSLISDMFVNKLEERKFLSSQISILYQSSLINLAVFFDLLISSLLRIRINSNPDSFNLKDKTLKFDEISNLGTLDNAVEYLIENEIESIMRGSFESWCLYFKKNLKRDLSFLSELEDDIIEIFQRRNLLVHNGCIANRIYFSKVAEKFKKDISVGDNLHITLEYLESSLNTLEKAGLLIGLDIWQNAKKVSPRRVEFVEYTSFNYMKSKKWNIALSLYEFGLTEKGVTSLDMCIFKVNRWLCYKSLGLYEEIKLELENADFSDKSLDLQLSVLALKNDTTNFFKLLPNAYPDIISLHSLMTWPILKEIRTTEEYKNFVKSCPEYNLIQGAITTKKEVALSLEAVDNDNK